MLRLILAVLAIAVFTQVETLNGSCRLAAQTGCKPCIRPDPDPNKKVENKAPDVTDVAVDRNEVKLPPPKQGDPPKHPDYSSDTTVNVITTASDPEGDTLVYNYTVSGGRIVGQGSNVTWDLNGVLPGTYTITAAVDDGCGLCGRTETRTVKVEASEGAPACICSEIRIEALHYKIRTTGRLFAASLSGPKPKGLTYQWTVSNGEIISGQGSSSIRASQPSDDAGPVTVTVEVSGFDPACGCPISATRTFSN
jgi:hypothetical protein